MTDRTNVTAEATVTTNTPVCQGEARWDERPQAEYVAEQLTAEFGTLWRVLPHGDHFHLACDPIGPDGAAHSQEGEAQ